LTLKWAMILFGKYTVMYATSSTPFTWRSPVATTADGRSLISDSDVWLSYPSTSRSVQKSAARPLSVR
jgi:hypothetical protein